MPLTFHSVAVAGCIVTGSLPVHAAAISGSFNGVVSSGTVQTSEPAFQDLTGTAVTGVFNVNQIVGAVLIYSGTYIVPSSTYTYSFTFAALGQTFSYGSFGTNAIFLSDDGAKQLLTLAAGFGSGRGVALSLTGSEGSLFDSIDNISSLHVGPDVSVASPLFFGNRFPAIGANIDVISSIILPPVQDVPEPPGWTIFGICLLTLAIARPVYATFGRTSRNIY